MTVHLCRSPPLAERLQGDWDAVKQTSQFCHLASSRSAFRPTKGMFVFNK